MKIYDKLCDEFWDEFRAKNNVVIDYFMTSMTMSLHDKHALNSCLWCWGQHQLSRRHCKPRHNAVRETDFNLKLYLIKINLINNKVHKINKHF